MKLYVGGVRGTTSVTGEAFAHYGGDSSSFLIEGPSGERVIIDAGTGIHHVASRLQGNPPESYAALLLFSHFHLDHLAGLPSFAPLYEEQWTIEMASRVMEELVAEDVVHSLLSPPLWPLTIDEFKARKRYRILDAESMEGPNLYGALQIRWCPTHHPGGSTAFRVDEPGVGSVVIATDLEWAESTDEEKSWLVALCATPAPADVLVFDGKYAPDQYEPFRGWGHSTWKEGIDLAQTCGVRELWITHHDRSMNDEACRKRDDEIRSVWDSAGLLKQGQEIAW